MKLSLFFFTLLTYSSIYGQRSDFVFSLASTSDTRGNWQAQVFCPSETYITYFNQKQECEKYGTTDYKATCKDILQKSKTSYITPYGGAYDKGDWQSEVGCSAGDLIQKFFVSIPTTGGKNNKETNDIGVNDLNFKCILSENFISPGGACSNVLGDEMTCNPGQAFCGMQVKFYDNNKDEVGFTDVAMLCCLLCKNEEGYFLGKTQTINLSRPVCLTCAIYCKTCLGASYNQCTSCFDGDALSNGICVLSNYYTEIGKFFNSYVFNNDHTDFKNFISDKSPLLVSSCMENSWVGGYSIFGKDNYLSYPLLVTLPHFKLRIKARFLKVDDWNGESIIISVDGVTQVIQNILNLGDNTGKIYFGNQCGQEFEAEDVINVDHTLDHSQYQNVLIKFTSTLTEDATQQSWAVRDIVVGVYKCDISCVTCSGPESNKCLECYSNAKLVSGICSCDSGYHAKFVENCVSFPCMTCEACYEGCDICSGSGQNECQKCKPNYYMNSGTCRSQCPSPFWGDHASMTCVSSCPLSNQYKQLSSRTCETCTATCLTCLAASNACLTCVANYYRILQSSVCVKTCPPGYYIDTLTKNCELCDFNCSTCSSKNICIVCNSQLNQISGGCVLLSNYITIDEQLKLPTFSTTGFILAPPISDISKCIYLCGYLKIFGGPNCIFPGSSIEKIHSNLIPHYQIRVTFFLMKIDSWIKNNFFLQIDGKNSLIKPFDTTTDPYNFMCGKSDSPDAYKKFDIVANHGSTSANIKFLTDLGSNDEGSWGIYDYTFYVIKCHETCLTCTQNYLPTSCTSCGLNAILVDSSCKCLPGFAFLLDNLCNSRPCSPCIPCDLQCKTCTGTLATQCSTCEAPRFLFQTNCVTSCPAPLVGVKATALCATICQNANDFIDENRICQVCHDDCISCKGEGPENCILCRKSGFNILLKDGKTLCLLDCGVGYYQILSSCFKCVEKCNKCDVKGCLECLNPYILVGYQCILACQRDSNQNQLYFNNATNSCERYCPLGTFSNQETNFCWPCAVRCSKCTGLLSNECFECSFGYYLFNNSCVDFCKLGYFLNPAKNSCEKCLEKCYRCNDEKSCEECENGLYIMRPNNDTCVTCNSKGNFKEGGVCLNCTSNCLVCEGPANCQVCLSNYYLNQGQCLSQKIIQVELKYDELNPVGFHLKFSNYWKNGFESLPSKIQIKIFDLNSQLYSYILTKNETDSTDFLLNFDFKANITLGMKLNVKLDLPTQDEFKLTKNELEMTLKEYYHCPDSNIYNTTSRSCYQAISIIPLLEYGNNLDELNFRLVPDFDLLLSLIPNNSIVSITGINFTYNFIPNGNSYIIKFNFNQTFLNKPVCKLFISTPSVLLYNSSNNKILEINTVSISMRNYYVLDNSVKNAIENSKKTTEQMNSISSTATMSNSFLSFGSSMAISIMMSMEIIRFLKYLDIDYPPNVEEMFKSSLRGSGIIPDVFLDIDPSENVHLPYQFAKYNNSIYAFNNNGNFLIENVFYFGIGLIFLGLEYLISRKYQNTLLNKLIELLTFMFTWNFAVTYFLGVFLNYIFFNILFFKFPAIKSVSGKFNMFYATTELLLIIFALLYFAKIIKNIHNEESKSEISIFPEQESLSIGNNSFKLELSSVRMLNEKTSIKAIAHSKAKNLKGNNLEGSSNASLYQKKLSAFQRAKTAYNKLADSVGIPTKVHAMSKIVNNFFSSHNPNKIQTDKDLHLSKKAGIHFKSRFGCLNKGLNHTTRGQSFYLLFDVLRQTIISFMIVFLFDNPITAMVIVNFTNLNFFALIAFIRPQREKIDQIQTIINELCVNLACFAAMALAIMERTGNEDPKLKFNVGWIIVAANIIFMAVFLGRFFLTIMILIGKKLIELIKCGKRNRNKVAPQEGAEEIIGSADTPRTPDVIIMKMNEKSSKG